MLFLFIRSLNSSQLSVVQQNLFNVKNILKNVPMKRLNQCCPNVHISMFHNFGLATAQLEIQYQKISWLVFSSITTTHKHWEEHGLISYFYFVLSLQKQKP